MSNSISGESALWLVPGLEFPVFKCYTEFFNIFFSQFQSLDYRDIYLRVGEEALERHILTSIEAMVPTFLIYTQFPSSYSYISPEFLNSLRARCAVVGLGFDDEIYFEQAKFFYQSCSAVITGDISGAAWLNNVGVPAYLAPFQQPLSTDGMVNVEEDIPVSFVGDMSKPGRRKYVQYLEAHGVSVVDFGSGSRNGRLTDSAVVDIFRRSKINLNFTATNPPRWVLRHDPSRASIGAIKGRPFELAAMGKFCLCEWASCVDFWFRPGIDIGVFRDVEDLVCQVRRYLEDDLLRRQVAGSAQARHRTEFSLESQFTRFFSIIRNSPRSPGRQPPRLGNTMFYESMGRSRGVAFLHALHRKSPIRALREPFTTHSIRLDYWRGFVGGMVDTLSNRLLQV